MVYLIGLIVGIILGYMAEKRGASFWLWFVYGFLLAPIAFIHAIIMAIYSKGKHGKQCVDCKEWINEEARVCKICRARQPQEEEKIGFKAGDE